MTDYAELRAALDAATPGPWTQGESAAGISCVWVGGKSEPVRDMGPDCSWIDCNNEPNARYIAACHPEAIRALLADYDRMRKALNEAVRVLESARLLCNWPSMNEAIDAAARDGRAALAQEQGGSDA